MGNVCVGTRVSLQSLTHSLWWSRSPEMIGYKTREISSQPPSLVQDPQAPLAIQDKPPEVVKMAKDERKPTQPIEPKEVKIEVKMPEKVVIVKQASKPTEPRRDKKPHNVKRMLSAGLQADSVLKTKTGHLKEFYNLGQKLGHGQFGST